MRRICRLLFLPLLCAVLICGGCRTWSAREERAVMEFNRGNELRESGKSGPAAAAYRRALEEVPEYHAASFNLALVLVEQGEAAEGLAVLEKLRKKAPSNLIILRAMGWAAWKNSEAERAVEYYREALALSPGDVEALEGLSEVYEHSGRAEQAAVHRRFLLGLNDTPANRLALAQALEAAGENREALALYRRVLAAESANIEALDGLSRTALAEGQTGAAAEALEQIVSLKPENGQEFLWRLGRLLLVDAGNYRKGLAFLQEAVTAGFSDRDAFEELLKEAPEDVTEELRGLLEETGRKPQ